jgi:ribosome maturation factor RimP
LFTAAHFLRFRGAEVALTALMPVAGQRKFKGIIKDVVEDTITIEIDGEQVEIAHGNIAKARLVPQI